MTEYMEDPVDHSFEDEPSAMEQVPPEVLIRIFSFLDLRMRGKATRVCRRWQDVIYSPRCEMDDVMVVNIFQRSVWDSFDTKNKVIRMPVEVDDIEGLERLFRIIRTASTVKFWYNDTSFANEAVDAIVSAGAKLKAVDMYPSGDELETEHIWESLPALRGMSIRPHNKKYFWKSMTIDSFPCFESLSSLSVDSISFDENVALPPNLINFEFQNREGTQYLSLLDQLKELKKLECFTLSHANMTDVSNCIRFLDALDASNIPTLAFLVLSYCKLPKIEKYYELLGEEEPIFEEKKIANLRKMNLRSMTFIHCCGEIYSFARSFIDFSPLLTIMSLQIIEEEDSMKAVHRLALVAEKRKVWMHLGIMQRDRPRDDFVLQSRESSDTDEPEGSQESPVTRPPVPAALFNVLTKFEASFVWKPDILEEIFSGKISAVQEIKLINCATVEDSHLEAIAKNAPMLRRLVVISCSNVSDNAMLPFVEHFDCRRTQKLDIVWKRLPGSSRPASFYLNLVHEQKRFLAGKSAKFFAKVFRDDNDGERVVVTDKTKNKKLVIQDFSDADGCQLIGVVVGEKEEDTTEAWEPPSEPAPPPPVTRINKLTIQSSV